MTIYYTLSSGALAALALPIRVNGRAVLHPTAAEAARYDAYPKADGDTPPTPPEGKVTVPDSWQVRDGEWHRTWRYEDAPPPPPRVFRKSWLAQWMYANGKWADIQAFLAKPDNEALEFMWSICTEFDEDAPQWPAALAAIKDALKLTDAEAEDMLVFGATGGQP